MAFKSGTIWEEFAKPANPPRPPVPQLSPEQTALWGVQSGGQTPPAPQVSPEQAAQWGVQAEVPPTVWQRYGRQPSAWLWGTTAAPTPCSPKPDSASKHIL